MTQEEKDLLLKDLCSRLPYGVKCAIKNSDGYHHENIAKIGETTIDKLKGFDGKYFNIYHDDPLDWDWSVSEVSVEDIKPYLFPLSSMTLEQKKELCKAGGYEAREEDCGYHSETFYYNMVGNENVFYPDADDIDWLNKNHFDYRGLIEKGLAIDATNLNIY